MIEIQGLSLAQQRTVRRGDTPVMESRPELLPSYGEAKQCCGSVRGHLPSPECGRALLCDSSSKYSQSRKRSALTSLEGSQAKMELWVLPRPGDV